MATSFETVYDRFLSKITDFNLPNLDDSTLSSMLTSWIISAISKSRKTEHDLSKRDDDLQEFDSDLSDLEIELLAMGMVDEWLGQYLRSTENVLQFIGGKEEKYYSQANHIAEIRALKEQNSNEMRKLHCYNTYAKNKYFD